MYVYIWENSERNITAMAKLHIYMNHMCAVSLANRLRAMADAFRPTTKQLIGEFHKSEVLLIASTLLVVKAKNIY